MSRIYFNGIGRITFNGTFLSFVLDDTDKGKSGAPHKTAVIELITELDAAEGICKYLLEEISKIKEIQKTQENNSIKVNNAIDDDNVMERPPVGAKIPMSNHDHTD